MNRTCPGQLCCSARVCPRGNSSSGPRRQVRPLAQHRTLAQRARSDPRAFFGRRARSVRRYYCRANVGTVEIENLPENCDEFVCKSSPAVEQTVRQISRAIEDTAEAGRAANRFTEGVAYEDGLRSFTGRSKYERNTYVTENVSDPKAEILRLRMDSNELAIVTWRLRGKNAGGKLEVVFTEAFKLNVITGRVEEHTASWNLDECDVGAKVVYQTTRAAYSVRQALQDVVEDIGPSKEEAGSDTIITGDPTDPMKFFQQEDTTMQDGITLASLLLALWIIVKGLTVLNESSSTFGSGF